MATVTIDQKTYEVDEGQNLLEACLSLGLDLPYFCWHPELGSAGACRQCAVIQYQNTGDSEGRMVMSCMTPVTDGLVISLEQEKARNFRAMVIETLMTNHPHDCPVCEEGGECHLQDMTLMTGHIDRRYSGLKRTHKNQYLGPLINHEMNRCIACYRCVRYYRDYSGGDDLNVFSSSNNLYFGRAEDGILESEFSGNLVEVCPTGVFTDKTFSEHYTRKWDLESSPSVCVGCGVGCNIYPGEHKGVLRRIQNRYHPDVNGHFLCDRGRFGYDFVNHPERLDHVWKRNNMVRNTERLTTELAESRLQEWISEGSVVAVSSPRSSLENNFALLSMVGEGNMYPAVPEDEMVQLNFLVSRYQEDGLPVFSLKQIEGSDAALVIGEDVTQTAPRLALSLRQMVRNAGLQLASDMAIEPWQDAPVRNIAQNTRSPLFVVNVCETRLQDVAELQLILTPNEQCRLLEMVDERLQYPEQQPEVRLIEASDAETNVCEEILRENAVRIADTLRRAKQPVIITGANSHNPHLVKFSVKVATRLHKHNPEAGFYSSVSSANSMGLAILPGHDQGLHQLADKLANYPPRTLVIMEADLYRYFPKPQLDTWLEKIKNIVVIDHLLTPTAKTADLLLPSASFAESHGCWVSAEGRLQAAYACLPPSSDRRPAWEWLRPDIGYGELVEELSGAINLLEQLPSLIPGIADGFTVSRQTHRASGRTAVYADESVKEVKPRGDVESPYQFSMEGVPSFRQNKLEVKDITPAYIWSPRWNSNQGVFQFQDEFDGPVQGANPGIRIFDAEVKPPAITESLRDNGFVPDSAVHLVPDHHIFGDDEMASYVDAIRELAPDTLLRINEKKAKGLRVHAGDELQLKGEKQTVVMACDIVPSLPDGIALVPAPLYSRIGHYGWIERVDQ